MSSRTSSQFNTSSLLVVTRLIVVFFGLTLNYAHAVQTTFMNKGSASVSSQQYEKLGISFAAAINNKDVKKLSRLFDMEAFAYKTANTVFDSKKEIDSYVKGLLSNNEEAFIKRVFTAVFEDRAKVKFLRVIKAKHPLIRVDYNDSGHEYVVLDTKPTVNNKLSVVDMFLLSSGKKLSMTLGAASQLMIRPSKSILKKLFNKYDFDEDIFRKFKKLSQLRKNQKYKESYELIESLPASVRNQRVMIDFSVQLSQFVSDDEYRKQLTRLDKYYGKDETTTFILIDHHFYNKNFNKAQQSIDRLIDSYGEDGALLNLKASTYLAANNTGKAKSHARRAIKLEPMFDGAYWTLVTILTSEENFPELIQVLDLIAKKFGYVYTANNFAGNPIYKKFIKSPEFKAWIK